MTNINKDREDLSNACLGYKEGRGVPLGIPPRFFSGRDKDSYLLGVAAAIREMSKAKGNIVLEVYKNLRFNSARIRELVDTPACKLLLDTFSAARRYMGKAPEKAGVMLAQTVKRLGSFGFKTNNIAVTRKNFLKVAGAVVLATVMMAGLPEKSYALQSLDGISLSETSINSHSQELQGIQGTEIIDSLNESLKDDFDFYWGEENAAFWALGGEATRSAADYLRARDDGLNTEGKKALLATLGAVVCGYDSDAIAEIESRSGIAPSNYPERVEGDRDLTKIAEAVQLDKDRFGAVCQEGGAYRPGTEIGM